MPSLFTYQNLFSAYMDCIKRKTHTVNAQKFEFDREKNLWDLLAELQNRTYRCGRSICFIANQPVIREIFAADFRDRVVHHLFVRPLEKELDPRFIHASFACRKGKGTIKALAYAQKYARAARNGYCLKCDIQGFFMSINKPILFHFS